MYSVEKNYPVRKCYTSFPNSYSLFSPSYNLDYVDYVIITSCGLDHLILIKPLQFMLLLLDY